jgi:HEPN domain-containing protein
MVDIERQVAYWRNGADEDWEVAQDLVGRQRVRHGLFFAHLALEKLLKAHVCRHTQDLAPRLHNLVRLAELAGLPLNQAQFDILAEMNAFNIEGRYPDTLTPVPSQDEANEYLRRAAEVHQWLMNQLPG